MWVLRNTSAPGVSLRRRISLLATLLVVAFFAICGPLVRTAFADGNATWSGDTLQYDSHDFASTKDAPIYQGMATEYQWIDSSSNPNNAYVFYFKDGTKPQQATSAQLVIYTYTAPSSYTSPSTPSTVQIGDGSDGSSSGSTDTASSCNTEYFGGVGWVVCSVSSWISKGVDGMYTLIGNFLEVDTISQGNNGVYAMWNMARSVANICFIIVFLIIVYSQLTSVGYSNYNIKDMIPRLIIAAIVVNVSFWICALFVDISNLLGYSIDALFNGIRDKLNLSTDINWGDITTLILSGGTATVGTLTFAAAAAGSWAALGFIILGTLVSAGMSLLAAFVILAIRQALIVVLVIIAPLAFVAMVLPSTKGLFHKWRKALTSMLVFFPIFALLFGGSQLAGVAIINSQYHIPGGGHIEIILIGLAVQVIPLAVTPLIMRFADGLFAQVSGMVNDKQRGIADRARNWTKDNADYHAARKKNKVASDIANGRNRGLRARGVGRLGLMMDQGSRNRKASMSDIDQSLEHRMEASRQRRISTQAGSYGRTMYETAIRSHGDHESADIYKKQVEAEGNRHFATHKATDGSLRRAMHQTAVSQSVADNIEERLKSVQEKTAARTVATNTQLRRNVAHTTMNKGAAAIYTEDVEGAANEAWQNTVDSGYLQVQRRRGGDATKRATDIENRIKSQDQRLYDTAVNQAASPVYARIRDMKVQTGVDTHHSKLINDQLDSESRRDFNQEFVGNAPAAKALRQQRYTTTENSKTADLIESRDKQEGEARFERISTNGSRPDLKSLRLQEETASGSLKEAQANWQKIVSDVQNKGVDSNYITNAVDRTSAGRMHQDARTVVAAESAAKAIQSATQGTAERAYIESQEGQDLAVRAQAAQDALDVAKTDESARMSELRTDAGAEGLTGEMAVLAEEMNASYVQKRAQEQRATNASSVANLEYAGKVLSDQDLPGTNTKIADVAAGVAGESGAAMARATAKETVISDVTKGIAASKTLVSQIPENEIIDQLNEPDILDQPNEYIAALGGTVSGRRHMASHVKLWRRVGELGAEAQEELELAEANHDQAAIENANKKIAKVKDLQQQVMQDKSKTPFGVSDADQGTAGVGQYKGNIYKSTRDRINTHLSPKRLSEMDPDDMRLLFEMARAGKLDDNELKKVRDAYAAWETDPLLGPSLEDKHRRLLDPIVQDTYPAPGDTTDINGKPVSGKFWDDTYKDVRDNTVLPPH